MFKKTKTDNQIEITGDLLIRLQKILLEMLKDFAHVCEKHDFYYSLCGGTALGAVRHGGFIPWDDDVDLFMHRKDVAKFIEVFESELGEKYHLHSLETTPELGIPIMRMMKKGTVLVIDDTLDCPERGVFIDICILENAPDNKLIRFFHGIGSLYFGLSVSCARFYFKRDLYRKNFESAPEDVKRTIEKKIRIGRLLSWRSLSNWSAKYSKWNALCKNNESRDVVCPISSKHYFGEIFPRSIYMTTTKVAFEDAEFEIISNYDWALTRLYGDYMQIPPEDQRETHLVTEIRL
ncbi:MAG: LicD family protein [Berryella intestinalis]|uniref:LicD family protein n=1 Tax=Berryella intestinalis TaxID=1531429 RepID=UPI002A5753EE|nr:LicD family protein [Berryella intestinalis]MDD7369382.1 LicD family protein [Berryella intestinalis]